MGPREIAEDRMFDNLGQAWLAFDHYKWRAMRLGGVTERFCTGDAPWKEKFGQWAAVLPSAIGNPLYAWSHLELRRYFGVEELLCADTAVDIYERCSSMLRTREFSARNLLRRMKVKVACTTDDPADDLKWHRGIAESGFEVKVLPTFRPDKARIVTDPASYNSSMDRLAEAAGMDIRSFRDLIEALGKRHAFFGAYGCRSSDHGLQPPCFEPAGAATVERIFARIRKGADITSIDKARFETAVMIELMRMDKDDGWVTQLHVGASRNLCARMFGAFGPDAGCDAIGDYVTGGPLRGLLDTLDSEERLPRTVVFNLNPRDNELVLRILGSFAQGPQAGKMQFGPAWWFADHRQGITRNLEALAAMGLLGKCIGMTTDSRSLLSFPRHEYFRRALCDFIGKGVERGEIPGDMELLGELVRNICGVNAIEYFGFHV
jgi:glucuronate isomerase